MTTHSGNSGAARRGAIAVALPILLLAGSAVAGEKLQRDERLKIEVKGQSTLVIKNRRGKTVVVGDAEARAIGVVASFVVKADSREAAQQILDGMSIDVAEGPDEIVVESRMPEARVERRGLLELLRGERTTSRIDYSVSVPLEFSVETWTTSGDVHISNIRGSSRVHATSGNVGLKQIQGAAVVELTSGDVRAVQIGNDLQISSTSGDAFIEEVRGLRVMATSGDVRARRISGDAEIQLINGGLDLEGCLGDLKFLTSTGDARIDEVDGSIQATTSSGDLDVRIVPVDGRRFLFNSSSGNIDVMYITPQRYGFLLDIATGTGRIEGDMAISVDEISRRKLRGRVGTGDAHVIIETASGDVTIREKLTQPPKRKSRKEDDR